MEKVFIQRQLSKVLIEVDPYFSVITITGPRQSGKTTLIRNHYKHLPYYSLEDLSIRDFASKDPVGFLTQHIEGMILDEIHNVPNLLSYIQGIVDENPGRKFVLSGSSQFAMLSKITQSLAGRTAVFELLPFSYAEVNEFAVTKSLDYLLFDGLYPAIYAGKNIPAFLYSNYVKTYLEKDVRDLLKIKDMMQFHTFLRLCAGRIGSIFNASELSNEVGVNSNTIASWLSVLQASYIITMLPPYFENTRKRLTKMPKLYFIDTGLACYLLGIETPEQLSRDKMRGGIFENFLVMEAVKNRFNQGKDKNLFFYRDSHQNEVDLIINDAQGLKAIEIKSSMTYNSQFEKSLIQLDNWTEMKIIEKAVVYAGTFENFSSKVKLLHYSNFNRLL